MAEGVDGGEVEPEESGDPENEDDKKEDKEFGVGFDGGRGIDWGSGGWTNVSVV